MVVIDLNRKEVLRVEDCGAIPLPPQAGNWARQYNKETRHRPQAAGGHRSRKGRASAFAATRSHGRSGTCASASTRARGWCFTRSRYDGRPVLYRASISEMIVPYADPKVSAYRKNAFDLGEYGVGMMANSLAIGCDCLGTIRYFDGHLADSRGRVITIKNAICVHEEDFGILWKHSDWRINQSEVRRARRLSVSMVATVGNYDYGFYWYFYQDGTIQMEVKLTGIMNSTGLKPGETPRYGTEVAPQVNAPNHQHFFGARLDFSVDGERQHRPRGQHAKRADRPGEPVRQRLLRRGDAALEGARKPGAAPTRSHRGSGGSSIRVARTAWASPWPIASVPVRTCCRTHCPAPRCIQRAGFLTRNLWVTPYRSPGTVPDRRLSQPEPRRRRPAEVDQGQSRDRRPRPGRLVQLRPDPHPARRGLARDAGRLGRLLAPARRLLRPQPGDGSAAAVDRGELSGKSPLRRHSRLGTGPAGRAPAQCCRHASTVHPRRRVRATGCPPRRAAGPP